MAHFAKINDQNVVESVIVVDNSVCLNIHGSETEALGAEFCTNTFGGTWIQTSYNSNFRKNFAGVGFTYDSDRDAFIPPKPFSAWVLNETTCLWEAPVAQPEPDLDTRTFYHWDSDQTQWTAQVIPAAPEDSA